jgi:uncharacterized protein (DUF342 family)
MFYLHHYFDPDFNHLKRAPRQTEDGIVNYHSLGYVQNVVEGQVLAETIDLDQSPDIPRDPRFISAEKHLPIGPNCRLHPNNPNKIVAAVNGYVFYNDGLISVKKLLNVRDNLGMRTGNILFIGGMAVHGDVQTDFAVMADNLLVKGHIESAKVKSHRDIVCLEGVKGANFSDMIGPESEKESGKWILPSNLLDAGGNIRLPFCEHAQVRARGNVVIDGSCLHSTLYVGGNLIIKGRLQGGAVYANNLVYVEKQLGLGYNMPTKIMMGYDPFDFLKLQKLESRMRLLKEKEEVYERMAARNEDAREEYAPRLDVVRRKLQIAHKRHADLWKRFAVDEQHAGKCRVVVPGSVLPGCEIGIARAWHRTSYEDNNRHFRLSDRDEEILSLPNAAKEEKE